LAAHALAPADHATAATRTAAGAVLPGDAPPLRSLVTTLLCAGFGLAGCWAGQGAGRLALYDLSYLAGGTAPTLVAVGELLHFRLSVDLLMVLAAAGAAALGDWGEGAVLLFLFSLSNTLEAYAMYRTTRSIDALIRLRAREACLIRDGCETQVGVDELQVGDTIRVRPGERFPVDGAVMEGTSWANESTLTGESVPVSKATGHLVYAGTINGNGSVLVRMTRAVADTTLERIVRLVRDAQAAKTGPQRLVESWLGPYVAGVFAASAFVFVGSWFLHRQGFADSLYHALVMLVVASPCAVVVGAPAVLLSAIARAARHGVLFKGGAHLEMLGRVDVIAFDKTGTITPGKPVVTAAWVAGDLGEDRLLSLAAAVERRSEHHLGGAVIAAATRLAAPRLETSEFEAHAGQGAHARVDGLWVGIGREALFESHGKALPAGVCAAAQRVREAGETALIVVADDVSGPAGGVIAVSDRPRPDAATALAALKRSGVAEILILTGDHERIARTVAERVGADRVRAGLMPDEKVVELQRLMNAGHLVAMVGDGVNDAPALATAHVGVAMGAAGTDVALEVADVVLIRDDLGALAFAVWLSRLARRRVHQNLVFACGVIGVLVLSSFFGLPLWMGVLGHEGSTLLVVLNGLRLLWERSPAKAAPLDTRATPDA
jgi:Cd2+/Zn2+-exporting ATPase